MAEAGFKIISSRSLARVEGLRAHGTEESQDAGARTLGQLKNTSPGLIFTLLKGSLAGPISVRKSG